MTGPTAPDRVLPAPRPLQLDGIDLAIGPERARELVAGRLR